MEGGVNALFGVTIFTGRWLGIKCEFSNGAGAGTGGGGGTSDNGPTSIAASSNTSSFSGSSGRIPVNFTPWE